MSQPAHSIRNLVVVFGDQLDAKASAFDGFDPDRDLVWMAESGKEASHVWSNKNRIVFFFSAMRHFAEQLRQDGMPLRYRELGNAPRSLGELLAEDIDALRPENVICTQPGEWRVQEDLKKTCEHHGIPVEIREDRHFYSTPEAFVEWAEGRKSIRLEYFYRELRKRHGILMTKEGKPTGGAWNFDKENRGSFGKKGPVDLPTPPVSAPDSLTKTVIALVDEHFPEHPGDLSTFAWPVTRRQALNAVNDFIEHRLADFGTYQDAMWTGQPFLYHSLISASLNVKLIHPREVVERAEAAYKEGKAPLNAVEGFIRQILGWREYVRGLYWWQMPDYLDRNALQAGRSLPEFYWTGDTPLTCLRESIGQTLRTGYAHHIQRLMVTGLYGLLMGVNPRQMHEWYLAVYNDAVEWVELPNTLGMSQYGDGGLMASKPYAASGKYINRMSNYCQSCPANPALRTGEKACPFTTLYWDFLLRHRERLDDNRRLALQLKNVDRLSDHEKRAIRARAEEVFADPSGKELFS